MAFWGFKSGFLGSCDGAFRKIYTTKARRAQRKIILCALRGSVVKNTLNVEVFYIEGVVLDKFAARFDLIAHQHGEDTVGFDGIFDPYL